MAYCFVGGKNPVLHCDPAKQGALPSLSATTSSEVESGGNLYGPDGRGQVKGYPTLVTMVPRGLDDDVASRLWAVSEDLTGVPFAIELAG